VLNIIPVIGQAFTMGYGLRQLKKMTEGQELPLPEWDDWGGDLKRGIMILLGFLAYSVPIIVLAIFSSIFTTIGANAAYKSNTGSTGIWGICVCGISILNFILGVALYVWAPAALLN